MIEIIKRFLKGFIGSFMRIKEPGYFSSRNCTAFAITIMVVVTHIKWFKSDHWEYLTNVLSLDFAMIATLFGLTTFDPKNKNNDTKKNEGS